MRTAAQSTNEAEEGGRPPAHADEATACAAGQDEVLAPEAIRNHQ